MAGNDLFIPEYYDKTDFETILTSVELDKHDKKTFKLPTEEKDRIEKILQRAVDREAGKLDENDISEDNPDGLDISLYKDESQLEELERKKKIEERRKSKPQSTPAKEKSATPKASAKKPAKKPAKTPAKNQPVKTPAKAAKAPEKTPAQEPAKAPAKTPAKASAKAPAKAPVK